MENTSDKKLDFVVIGVQKSATTWIYDCIKEHPELNLRASKNEDHYYGGPTFVKNGGEKWYFDQFNKKSSGLKGCVSVDYIEDPLSAERLYKLNPAIKVIISLRNPVTRTSSAYKWYVRKALIPDQPINDGISEIVENYNNNTNKTDIIQRGFYSEKIENFLKVFPAQNIHVIFFEEIKQESKNVVRDLFRFLKINDDFVPPSLNTIPKKSNQNFSLKNLERLFPKSRVISKLVDKSNQLLYKKNITKEEEKLNEDLTKKLIVIYEQSNEKLKKTLDKINPSLKDKMGLLWKSKTGRS